MMRWGERKDGDDNDNMVDVDFSERLVKYFMTNFESLIIAELNYFISYIITASLKTF